MAAAVDPPAEERDQWTVTLHGPNGRIDGPVKVDMVPGGPDGKYLVNAGEITFKIPEGRGGKALMADDDGNLWSTDPADAKPSSL